MSMWPLVAMRPEDRTKTQKACNAKIITTGTIPEIYPSNLE